ncbi:hypothetical protein B0T16DRAFT_390277 [Cercophora newfieldiana]|uniref:Uncharacterized protein n=1 Tax=Cercophora newfieldiana TaxID=92897 RepID=A0AA39Y4S2_9PEZI|nr:hypothetical protein B0T16DRAFT_390277 [Cercophora newfieldiana]
MRLLAILSAVAVVQSFIFPADRPDGVYTVSIDAEGNALDEPKFISALPDTARLSRRQAPALPNPSTNCHNRALDVNDFGAALSAFNAVCDRGEYYPENTSMVVSAGNTMAYLCNYQNSNRCWSSESNEASRLMDQKCGSNGIGWVYVDQYKKSYGRESKEF